jgi:plasmid stability protein
MNLDSMPEACHSRAMASLQVKNIPDKLRQRLQRYAREHGCTLGEVVLTAVERELARSEWSKRLARRPTTQLGVSAASLLEQEREQRKSDLA